MFDKNYVNYKIDYEKEVVMRVNYTKSGSLRMETLQLHKDDDGLYVIRFKKKIYLNHNNCLNFVDRND